LAGHPAPHGKRCLSVYLAANMQAKKGAVAEFRLKKMTKIS
jgi:hypothetical protein